MKALRLVAVAQPFAASGDQTVGRGHPFDHLDQFAGRRSQLDGAQTSDAGRPVGDPNAGSAFAVFHQVPRDQQAQRLVNGLEPEIAEGQGWKLPAS